MQTVLPPEVIKTHFFLLQELNKSEEPFLYKRIDRFFICFVKDSNADFRDRIEIAIEDLKIPSYELTSCFLTHIPRMGVMGYVLRCEDNDLPNQLKRAIEQAIQHELEVALV